MASLKDLLNETLPLNRKERFYTGTVLPGLLGEDLRGLRVLGELMGSPALDVKVSPQDCTVLMFTEYGLRESLIGPAADRFPDLPLGRDTPDIVALITEPAPVVLAIEAKLYDRPGGHELRRQLDAQAALLLPLCERLSVLLGGQQVDLRHVALLPQQQRVALDLAPYPVLTWQEVRAALAAGAPEYWLGQLDQALERYEELVSMSTSNAAAGRTGEELVSLQQAGQTLFSAMGRQGGLAGQRLQEDVASGGWRTTTYQVAASPPPGNPNWFTVTDFVSLLASRGELEDPPQFLLASVAHAQAVSRRVFGQGSVSEQLLEGGERTLHGVDAGLLREVGGLYQVAAEAARAAREASSPLLGT
jgi:hypothetical protein